MKTHAHISPERLIEVCDYCIKEHKEFKGVECEIEKFSFLKLERVKYKGYEYPRWATRDCGLIIRLNTLKRIAEAVIEDGEVKDRDIKLSETTYSELMKMYNKASDFQPYVFAGGY